MTRRRKLLIVASAAVVVIAVVIAWATRSSDDKPDWSAIPAVTPRPAAAVAAPSDEQVWAAIGQFDPCRLAAAGGRADGASGVTARLSPEECLAGNIKVWVGVPYTTLDLYARRRTNIAGYATWVGAADTTSPSVSLTSDECAVIVPTRAASALVFRADDSSTTCAEVTATARAALTRLARRPHAFDVATPRPTACQLVAIVAPAHGGLHELSQCYAGEALGVHLRAGDDGPYRDDTSIRLSGVSAVVSRRLAKEVGSGCSVRLPLAGRPAPGTDAVVLARNCGRARALGRRMVSATAHWTPPAPPRQSVFYRFDAPDLTGVGACRDVIDQQARRCARPVVRTVPDDPVDRIRHAEADPDVLCSAAAGLLRDHSIDLEPVTADIVTDDGKAARACVLADPQHRVELDLWASRAPVALATTTKVGGHRAYAETLPARIQDQVALGDPDDRGSLHIELISTIVAPLHKPDWFDGFASDLVTRVL